MDYNHFQYGEALAASLKAVAHTPENRKFFTATEEEEFLSVEDSLSSVTGTFLVAIDGSNSDLSYQPDNMTERPQYFFVILRNTESSGAHTISAAQSHSLRIARQVIARMMQDYTLCRSGLQSLDPDSFVIRGVGPIGDNFYGVLIGFNLLRSFPYTLDPRYWL